jgi:ADP-heptose:LPS heptosyltransferase
LKDHAYLPVKTKGYDFRDKLSLGGLIALLSKAKILVTNDSAPLHIAGAWDNHIVLIPSCKHPDFILPYRHGSKQYKTHTLYKKVMHDTVRKGDLPTDLVPWVAKDWPDMELPEPKEIIDKVLEIVLV